jgi:hypothetical protein
MLPEDLSEDEDEDLAAIREALDSLDRGEAGIPLDEVFRSLREKYNLPPK